MVMAADASLMLNPFTQAGCKIFPTVKMTPSTTILSRKEETTIAQPYPPKKHSITKINTSEIIIATENLITSVLDAFTETSQKLLRI